MAHTFCALCGKGLPKGKPKYIVHINIVSDLDEFPPYASSDTSKGSYDFLRDGDEMDGRLLEDTYSQELSLYLCVQCKKRFARDILESEEEDYHLQKKNIGRVYH